MDELEPNKKKTKQEKQEEKMLAAMLDDEAWQAEESRMSNAGWRQEYDSGRTEKIPEDVQSIRLNEWKEYLSKKPIKVVCERETSVVESIGKNPYSLNAFEGDTYIIIEDKNGLTPQLMFSYKIESAYREAILNSQTQAVTNHEDVNESIVPYLMDMEMNLMSLDDFGGGDI